MKKKKATSEAMWTLDPAQKNLKVTHTQKKKDQLRFMKYTDTDKFLGFVVVGGGHKGAPVVRPIYEATLHLQPAGGKDVDKRYMFSSFEVGERLSGYNHQEDPDGVTLATIAAMALGFLQQRTASAKRMQEHGLARDLEAFKAFAASIGIKVPEVKPARTKGKRRPKACTCAAIGPAGGPCDYCWEKAGNVPRR